MPEPPRSHLAEALVRSAFAGRRRVPVDLEGIARDLGVSEVVTAQMTEDGRTTWHGGRPRIELRDGRPKSRTRFTFAHEVGHILIARDESVVRRTRALDADATERLCDEIAAAILMPREWVLPYASREKLTLSLVRLVAHRGQVSLSAAAVRLAEVGGRTCALLRWQRGPARWLVVERQAGVPGRFSGLLEASPSTSELLDQLPSRRDIWVDVLLMAGERPLHALAHVDRSGSTCLTLLTSIKPVCSTDAPA
ncbi:MAG: ImmA/IrrE family metallo-endopeptidase [Dehalococcoidia bacterium]